ncbi:MAG TPA: tyrosine-type recombinase/integrase [Candidatus Dormibacteraeota bacterium]|nr:tyrosine-type recombinase/integrase [Candidatus Dormibacteraeota bacterium]
MMWDYWITLYTRTHCVARGLRPLTIAAYDTALQQFRAYTAARGAITAPDQVTARAVLAYLQYLRVERGNGDAAVNRQLVILRSFYRAIVAMGHLAPDENPLIGFPSIKAVPRKLPHTLTPEEIRRLLARPRLDTVIGLRDRAILAVLYGTGIRASECASLQQRQLDLEAGTLTVTGKGGHQRTLPLNPQVVAALRLYAQARGPALPSAPVFRSRRGRAMSRHALFDRVRVCGRGARVSTHLSPHRLRHTFASHLVRAGVGLVTIRDLLGHRQLSSTQLYLHVTGQDLREAADRHPIGRLLATVAPLLPQVRLPFQHARVPFASG